MFMFEVPKNSIPNINFIKTQFQRPENSIDLILKIAGLY